MEVLRIARTDEAPHCLDTYRIGNRQHHERNGPRRSGRRLPIHCTCPTRESVTATRSARPVLEPARPPTRRCCSLYEAALAKRVLLCASSSSTRFRLSSEATASGERADQSTDQARPCASSALDEVLNRVRAVAVAEPIVTAITARWSSAEDRCAAGGRARRGAGRHFSALGSPGRPHGGRPRSVPEGRPAIGGLPAWRHR